MEQEINVTSVRREQYWQEQMTAWKASGLKQMQYCREHQLSKHAFVYWKLKLLGKDPVPATLVPVSDASVAASARPGWLGADTACRWRTVSR